MFSSFTSFGVPKFGFGKSAGAGSAIDVPKVEVQDIETSTEKRARRLKHLLKLNHANFSILYNRLRFHNHTPHLLGSAYLLGASADHLNDVYEDAVENEGHEPWVDSPGEIALHDYRDFLGKREYQRAFVDFFEDQMVLLGYDWQGVVQKFLLESTSKNSPNHLPMFNCLTSGLGHPLIHLGYAFELTNREVAMEALGLAATCYDPHLASFLETSSPTTSTANPLTYSTSNIFEVFARVQSDSRLSETFDHIGGNNLTRLLTDKNLTSILLEHWSAWKIPSSTSSSSASLSASSPTAAFAQSQRLATALLLSTSLSTSSTRSKPYYDFFLVHTLTTSHAVRILVSFLPPQHHISLLREWFLITLALYIAQLRPLISEKAILDLPDPSTEKDWKWIDKQAIEGEYKFDAHFVKAARAMKECARVWGDEDKYFLKAAVKFVDEFDGWGGFRSKEQGGEDDDEEHLHGGGRRYDGKK